MTSIGDQAQAIADAINSLNVGLVGLLPMLSTFFAANGLLRLRDITSGTVRGGRLGALAEIAPLAFFLSGGTIPGLQHVAASAWLSSPPIQF